MAEGSMEMRAEAEAPGTWPWRREDTQGRLLWLVESLHPTHPPKSGVWMGHPAEEALLAIEFWTVCREARRVA